MTLDTENQRLTAENKELRAALFALQQEHTRLLNQHHHAAQIVSFLWWAVQQLLNGFAYQEIQLNTLRGLNRKVMQNAAHRLNVQVIKATEFEAERRGD